MDIRVVLILALALLTSCAIRPAPPQSPSNEIFDEQNATTLLVTARPLVFARSRSDIAAYARDYATLVAVELDNSGEYEQYVLLYRWSTVDKRMEPPPPAEAGALRILADDRAIDLMPLEKSPVNFAQRRELHLPKHDDVVPRTYKIDVKLLRFIAGSRELRVVMPKEALTAPFTLYEDGRNALSQFLQRTAAP